MRDEGDRWSLEHVLVTIQQTASTAAMDIAAATIGVLRHTYSHLQDRDGRWRSDWRDVAVMINPNGPLVEAGSDGDNGQTGRKLVMDFYGPRIPIGGGALSGKHLTHIDRIGAYAAREAAVRAVQSGAHECLVRLSYAPNHIEPIDIFYRMSGKGERQSPEFFSHPKMAARYAAAKHRMRHHRIDRDRGFESRRQACRCWSNADSWVAKPSQAVQYRRD